MEPGDMALVTPHDAVGWWISTLTRSRYCHVRLITDAEGGTLEAQPGRKGAIPGRVQPGDVISSPPMTDEQRSLVLSEATKLLGVRYGFLDIIALGLAAFNIKPKWLRDWVGREDRLICSQLVDKVWSSVGYQAFDDKRLPQDVNPGDLADLAFMNDWPTKMNGVKS